MSAEGFSDLTSSLNFRTFNTGTLNARTFTDTNITTLSRRIGFDSLPTADANAGCRLITTSAIRGFLSGTIQLGGFHYSALFSIPTYTTASRAAIGLFTTSSSPQSSSILTGDPQTWTNFVGMCYNLGSASWSIFHNDQTEGTTIVELGTNFPTNVSNFYEFQLFSPPGGNALTYFVLNKNDGNFVKGILSTSLPASGAFLAPQIWINNGSQSINTVGIDICGQYLRTFS